MFGTRNHEGVAAATWHEFLRGLGSTRDVAAERGAERAEAIRDTLSDTGTEARRRASAAFDVLAGRPAPVRWSWVLAAGAVGALVGFAAAEALRGHPVDEAVVALRRQLGHAGGRVRESAASLADRSA
ncbi:hypothetical protein Cs7R123_57470 [Catellatospora sp. TT07R-123]|uniref:hypothetical protein n=1 Tax=Catellatospora sp. TT07R-123 TaxID=2733863 RepID=UPI001B26E46D|nr:hypothetical protein [Catellatospora sp. TT07R-123]GHJ48405.1 hypothetical protein Cs7R123_57470 [Catellatospora sp. TT07R-123]